MSKGPRPLAPSADATASAMSTIHLGTPSTVICVVGKSGLRARDIDGEAIQQTPHAWAERALADALLRCKRAVVQEYAIRAQELL